MKNIYQQHISIEELLFSSIVQSAEAQAVIERYETLMALLNEFDMRLFSEWANCVPAQIVRNLKRSLLTRTKNNSELLLNFHNQVSNHAKPTARLTSVHPRFKT